MMDEILKNNTCRILELFIEFPAKDFSVRGLARELELSHATVLNHITGLLKLGFIKKKEETLYPTYFANAQSPKYRLYKKNWIVFKLAESGLIEHLWKQTQASSIILFGSCAKGEFRESSDIDLFVEAEETKISLSSYEKLLHKKINLLFEPSINDLSEGLKNNIINGIILYGFLKVNGKIWSKKRAGKNALKAES